MNMNNVNAIESSPAHAKKILLKSVFGKPLYEKKRSLYLPPSKNEHGRFHSDFVRRVDAMDDLILGTQEDPKEYFIKESDLFEIYDGKVFDLSVIEDERVWNAIKESKINDTKLIADSFEDGQFSVTAMLYVHEEDIEAKKEVKVHATKYEAMKLIMEDSMSNLYKIADALGNSMQDSTLEVVQSYLLSIAAKTPKQIIDLYNDNTFTTKVFLIDAISKDVIIKQNGIYIYMLEDKPLILGTSEKMTIEWLLNPVNRVFTAEMNLRCNPPATLPKGTMSIVQEEIKKSPSKRVTKK